jgi:acetyltransferase-like isoleucine patch superfamily enzyme
MISIIKSKINNYNLKKEWRRRNANNSTTLGCDFNFNKVKVGNYTYGELKVLNYGVEEELHIGSFCSIAGGVVFVLNADHYLYHTSTFPFKAKVLNMGLSEATSKGNIIVDDDVWIGENVIVLSGVHIGQGAVVAAGAVVTHDIPPYAIFGGMPAKLLKYRFDQETIQKLLELDYKQLTKELIQTNIDELYKDINVADLNWFPRKKGNRQ